MVSFAGLDLFLLLVVVLVRADGAWIWFSLEGGRVADCVDTVLFRVVVDGPLGGSGVLLVVAAELLILLDVRARRDIIDSINATLGWLVRRINS